MKLHSIKIADHRVLHNFKLEFQNAPAGQEYALDLIVGVNGTGKSTLLRALATIFRCLERGEMPPFGFEVTYQRDGSEPTTLNNLNEESEPLADGLLRVSHGLQPSPGTAITIERLESSELPPLVVAFTTGSEREWELDDSESAAPGNGQQKPPRPGDAQFKEQLVEWYLRELPGEPVNETLAEGEITTSNIFLFITAEYMPLVILCGMLSDMKDALLAGEPVGAFSWKKLQKAVEEPRIRLLRGFSLRLRMNRDVLSKQNRLFIYGLMQLAHHTVQTGSDYLLVFDLVKAQPEHPGEEVFDQAIGRFIKSIGMIEFFKRLIGLARPGGRLDPILRDVDLFLEKGQPEKQEGRSQEQPGEKPPLHLLRWLSDGEQSFLGRMCLISLLGESEALILLDEPEVHFNDTWKRQLVFMLHQSLQGQRSHVLMTTHSSITLSDVQKTSIWVLRRTNGYTDQAISPPLRTLGADPSDIMVSVFGAPNAAGAQGIEHITSTINKIVSNNNKTRKEELENLLSEVGPGYWRFLIRRQIHALESEEEQ